MESKRDEQPTAPRRQTLGTFRAPQFGLDRKKTAPSMVAEGAALSEPYPDTARHVRPAGPAASPDWAAADLARAMRPIASSEQAQLHARLGELMTSVLIECSPAAPAPDMALAIDRHAEQLYGAAASPVELEILIGEARKKLIGLGPLETWLSRNDIHRLSIRGKRIHYLHDGQWSASHDAFEERASVERFLQRLGAPLDTVWSGLVRGWQVTSIPSRGDYLVEFQRLIAGEDLDSWRARGALDNASLNRLRRAMAARTNAFVTGAEVDGLVAAMMSEVDPSDVLWLGEGPEGALVTDVTEEVLERLHRLSPRWVVACSLPPPVWPALLDTILRGRQGVVFGMVAPTIETARRRLASTCEREFDRALHAVEASFGLWVECTLGGGGLRVDHVLGRV